MVTATPGHEIDFSDKNRYDYFIIKQEVSLITKFGYKYPFRNFAITIFWCLSAYILTGRILSAEWLGDFRLSLLFFLGFFLWNIFFTVMNGIEDLSLMFTCKIANKFNVDPDFYFKRSVFMLLNMPIIITFALSLLGLGELINLAIDVALNWLSPPEQIMV